ncbi:hypothetical protein FB45DRAFT_85880 [Roridomyces roridus]|uniref:Jacalin-type lectin domain-containing protein n=1 Tax=Roridomyces roridus TaxID=1738132 RepID=A0AAD7FK30_9AGAR|nr:hypothetical protein FB45DRAFT_85880 [Roridomyces roridus]
MDAAATQYNTAIVQSPTVGRILDAGRFNDIEQVISSGGQGGINANNPISKIIVLHGEVIDGLEITYRKTDGGGTGVPVPHGTSTQTTDTNLQQTPVELKATEQIIAITGMHGLSQPDVQFGHRVVRIQFAIYDKATGEMRVTKVFGSRSSTPFVVTANGNFVSFGGYAINSLDSVAQAAKKGVEGGIYGLFFDDVEYETV